MTLKQAIEADACDRAAEAGREVSRGLAWAAQASKLMDLARSGAIPERITHNDTKFNNVMIDDATGRGTAVIDLDTVMPGLSVIDFGEMVRTGAARAAEDERDLTQVGVDLEKFERLARGYVSAAREFLTPVELDHLAYAARLMTYENAIRFLTDYLVGDTYYKIHRSGHNLDRARAQFALLADMERQADRMQEIVNRYRSGGGPARCGPGMQSEPE
jgi:Ser/Thr protein kinase RdoA (MazF antagonist)